MAAPTETYQLAYEQAQRALDFQRAALDALRSRAGLMFSAAALSTSFFGGLALRDEVAGAWAWTALALFVAFSFTALRILWPRAEGSEGFTAVASDVIAIYAEQEQPLDPPMVYRELALHMEFTHNTTQARHVEPLTRWFRLAIVLLTAEIVVWIIELA